MSKIAELEKRLLEANNELSRVLRQASATLPAAVYELLIGWGAFLRISRGLSLNTCRNYIHAIAGFVAWLGDRDFKSATAGDINDWQRWLYLENGLSSSARSGRLVAIRGFYDWLELEGHGVSNPARGIKGPKRDEHSPKKYTTSQLRAMLMSCDRETIEGKRDFAIILFFYATGARRGEVESLDLNQLDMSERVTRVTLQGKGKKERVVAFEGPAVVALRDWLLARDTLDVIDRDAVFIALNGSSKGRRLKHGGLLHTIKRAGKSAKVPVGDGELGVHKLRSTFATDMYDAGTDIRTISFLMGHKNINTTMRYIAISETRLSARMPTQRLHEITGGMKDDPRWFKHKKQKRDAKKSEPVVS